jgi:hypothetical protein
MRILNAPRPRLVAAWASFACIAVLLTACNSSTSSSASPSVPATSPGTPASSPGIPAATPSLTVSPTGADTFVTASPTAADTFLAAEQSLNGTFYREPACGGYGCALSGDSTAFLSNMTWSTWSGTEAVGAGAYKLDDCQPNCAAGTVYAVTTVVTLTQPVKVCSPSGIRWVWSHASFAFPSGLPKVLQGQNAPQNPWTFSTLITAAQQTCGN